MMRLAVLVLVALVVACYAAPFDKVPNGWERVSSPTRSLNVHAMNITVAIKQRNVELLEPLLYAVSDPTSPKYGQHLSFAEMVDLVSPTKDVIQTVVQYFTSGGVSLDNIYLHSSQDVLNVFLTVEQAQNLFATTYSPFRHVASGVVAMLMDTHYTIPSHIAEHIDIISAFNKITTVPSGIVSQRVEQLEQPECHHKKADEMVVLSWSGGDKAFYMRSLISCKDGSVVNLTGTYQSGTQKLRCGSTYITSFDVKVRDNESDKQLVQLSFNTSTQNCFLCSKDSQGRCPKYAYQHNISLSTVECRFVPPTNVTIPNYVPYYLEIRPIYSDGSKGKKFKTSPAMGEVGADIYTVKDFYGIPRSLVGTQASNSQSAATFLGQSISNASLPIFFAHYGIPDYSNLATIVNPQYWSGGSYSEGELDMQSLMGIAQNISTSLWCEDPDVWIFEWITDVLNHADAALVNSISYGDVSPSPFYNPNYIGRCDIELMKAGIRGLTVIASSGDNGVYGYELYKPYGFFPEYPAESPFVTAVGGTLFWSEGRGPHKKIIEVACSNAYGSVIASGGGFSDKEKRPYYQERIIADYLKTLPHNILPFNRTNRAFPDVAMIAHNVPTLVNGVWTALDGTSASSPFFAATITLLNDVRMARGKSPLGFLNPLIYQLPARCFNDITIGNGYCNSFECAEYGYPVQKGWDPSTGRGTPVFSEWLDYAISLP